MTRHTPGPWFVFKGDSETDRPGINSEDPSFSIVVYGTDDDDAGVNGRTVEERDANARLLAAAPDLLAALRDLINEFGGSVSVSPESPRAIAARAALAKAEAA